MAGKHVVEITDDNFDAEVMKFERPVLLDFGAPWCPPCRAIAPVVAQLAAENEGKARVGMVDIDESPATALRFAVNNIPTLLVIHKGQVVQRFTGVTSKRTLQSAIDAVKAA